MYKPISRFIFRSPLLPFNSFVEKLNNKNKLIHCFSEPIIQEAIYLASPVLYNEIQKYLAGEINDNKKNKRIINSYVRYLSRMSTRSTPFGLFAGCGVGYIGNKTNINIEDTIKRTTRLDMYYLCKLYDILVKKDEIKNKIKYFPNSSIYPMGKKLRYIESSHINIKRKYQISEIKQTAYLNSILKNTNKGIYIQKIAKSLANEYITIDDAIDYIGKLIDAQVLIGELSNSVTGEDFLSRIIRMLERIKYSGNELFTLTEINKLIKDIDNNIYNNNISIYEKIIKFIEQTNIPFEKKYLFQVDMIKKASSAILGQPIIDELTKTMEFLNKITPLNKNETIKQFQEAFYKRYKEREIPLMEAVDPESGIGYPPKSNNGDIAPLIDNFEIPQQHNQTSLSLTAFTSLLMQKTIECLSKKRKEIIFHDDDIKNFKSNWDDLPPTIYTVCEILDTDKMLIKASYFGGSCAANLLGRFAHTDQEIDLFVRDITRQEQELIPNIILAEIVHLPEARIGNIQSRPHFRDYELLYLSDSDLLPTKIIHVSDLMLSIKQGRLAIRSNKLNKEIIPRLTTAHNYRNNSMPVYRFLCDMQHPNGRSGIYFTWGHLENELKYRPRVRYNNTILAPASWSIEIKDIKHLFEIENDIDLIAEVKRWRESILLPQKVLMPDGDNELYIDWDKALSIKSLFSIIKKRQNVKFNEFLYDTENFLITNGTEKYLNECIIAFYK